MRAVKYIFIKKNPLAFHVHSEVVISTALNIRRTRHLERDTWRDKSLNIADANTTGTLKNPSIFILFIILDTCNSVN